MQLQHEISVLHVEDSDADAKLVEIALKRIPYHSYYIHRAIDMETAKHVLVSRSFDLVLLDLYLPDSHGLETLQRFRAISSDCAIIVVTGSDDEGTALRALNSGAQDYMMKNELDPRTAARSIRYSLERYKYDKKVVELANIDMLTGLPNRPSFMDHLENAIAQTHRVKGNLSLLFIDCDHFKVINDTLGHNKGDEFLVIIGTLIKDALRSSDFVARLGGDEFVLVITCEQGPVRSPLMVANKVLARVRAGVELSSGEVLDARCSIGITNYDGNAPVLSADKFIHEADSAMYVSKRRGGDCVSFFDQALEEKAERRLSLLRDISGAFKTGEFFLNYQPIVDASTNSCIGVEALLRWQNINQELITPTEFIPLLEENGLIHTVGKWIIEKSLSDFDNMIACGAMPKDAWVSVNISPTQLQDKNFMSGLRRILDASNVSPSALQLEITESVLMEKSEHVLVTLDSIRDLGCKLAIDDFGVGYSSMSYLKNLPVDTLKIDRSFIRYCRENPSDTAITRAMISLAHNLRMRVVAEGVETPDVSDFLNGEHCDYLQGFYFSRPLGLEELKHSLSGNDISSVRVADK